MGSSTYRISKHSSWGIAFSVFTNLLSWAVSSHLLEALTNGHQGGFSLWLELSWYALLPEEQGSRMAAEGARVVLDGLQERGDHTCLLG